MPTTRAIGTALAMLGVLAIAGCRGGSGDGAASPTSTGGKGIASGEPTPPQTSSSSAPPSPTTTTPTANSTEAGAPGVPKAARQHTKAGAVAFAEYYMSHTNELFRDPTKGTLDMLDMPSCTPCVQNHSDLRDMKAKGQHFDRDQAVFHTTRTLSTGDNSIDVFMDMKQNPARVLDSSGKVISTTPTPHIKGVVLLTWLDRRGWRVKDLTHE